MTERAEPGETLAPRRVFVYASAKRAETYVYLKARDAFDDLPAELRDTLGELHFVIDFELECQRRLARADGAQVLAALASRGFYLQLAPHPAPDKVVPH